VSRAALLLLAAAACGCAARTRRFIGYRLSGEAPASVVCGRDGAARWCVHEPKGKPSGDLVYFLHYATGDERSWERLGLARAFYGELRRLGAPAPRVVTVSYGEHWLLSSRAGLRQTVTLQDFSALRARIEKGLGPVRRRYAWGMSMGGYNAAEAALASPGDWAAVALQCPALEPESPYREAPASSPFPRENEGREMFTWRLADEAAWRADDPAARAAASRGVPRFWIEADEDDEFGFYAGALAFERALKAAGASVELVATKGEHCLIDARAAARFLAGAPGGR